MRKIAQSNQWCAGMAPGHQRRGKIFGYYGDSSGQAHGFETAVVALALPVMLDAVTANDLTKLSGTAEANSSVSVFDGTKLVGTVTAAADGTWSFNTNVTSNVIPAIPKRRSWPETAFRPPASLSTRLLLTKC